MSASRPPSTSSMRAYAGRGAPGRGRGGRPVGGPAGAGPPSMVAYRVQQSGHRVSHRQDGADRRHSSLLANTHPMTSRAKSNVVYGGNGTEYGDVPTEEQELAQLHRQQDEARRALEMHHMRAEMQKMKQANELLMTKLNEKGVKVEADPVHSQQEDTIYKVPGRGSTQHGDKPVGRGMFSDDESEDDEPPPLEEEPQEEDAEYMAAAALAQFGHSGPNPIKASAK